MEASLCFYLISEADVDVTKISYIKGIDYQTLHESKNIRNALPISIHELPTAST